MFKHLWVERGMLSDLTKFFLHFRIVGERAKRARHSQVCSIENHDIYIIVRTYVTFAL